MTEINVRNVDENDKRKAVYVLKCKGKNLSTEIRNHIKKIASEFDKIKK